MTLYPLDFIPAVTTILMSYRVYRVASLGVPRNHHVIFVETGPDGSGDIVNVVGDVQNGMTFEHQANQPRPETDATFVEKWFLGQASVGDFSGLVEVCEALPPPKKQFDGPRRLFPGEPLRRCQEWTTDAIQALRIQGVLREGAETAGA